MDGIKFNIVCVADVKAGSPHVLPLFKAFMLLAENCEGCDVSFCVAVLEEILISTVDRIDRSLMDGFYDDVRKYEAKVVAPMTRYIAWLTNERNELMCLAYMKGTIDVYTICNLYTPPEHRNKGMATRLTKKLFELNDYLRIGYVSLCVWEDGKKWCEKNGWHKSFSNYNGKEVSYVRDKEHCEKHVEYIKECVKMNSLWIKDNGSPGPRGVLDIPHYITSAMMYTRARLNNKTEDCYADYNVARGSDDALLTTKWNCKTSSKKIHQLMGSMTQNYKTLMDLAEMKKKYPNRKYLMSTSK